jgi:hypothetical protein
MIIQVSNHFRVLYRIVCFYYICILFVSCFAALYAHLLTALYAHLPCICYCFTGWQYHPVFCR